MKKSFKIGGTHPHDNKISKDAAIEEFPVQEKMYITMTQHLGAPAIPIVKKGDKIKTGQLIAEPGGFISGYIHSSVSGTVSAVEPVADFTGNMVNCVVIDVEGDEWEETIDRSGEIVRNVKLSREEILERIKLSGIVGLGGAAFPTHIKLSPPPDKKVDCLIINGAECEPFLTSDYRLMIEHSEEILIGIKVMMKALDTSKCYIGIEDNKPDAKAKLSAFLSGYPGIEIVELKARYPQGGEKQLIDAVVGRRVPSLALPVDVGVVVHNVGTVFAVYEAVQKNRPLIDSIVSFTGTIVSQQRNFRLKVGTPIESIIEYYGGVTCSTDYKVIHGGPMMGKAVSNLKAPSLKNSSAILILPAAETLRKEQANCIRCSKCTDVCPMGLEPYLLNKLYKVRNFEELESNLVYDCIECGCCLYTCPSYIPLLDNIRVAKAEVMSILRSRPKK